jgi:hypothetical protein
MSTWVKLLPIELDNIKASDIIEPNFKAEKGDRIVGTMSDATKRLFTLCCWLEKEADQAILDRKYCTKSDEERLDIKINQCKVRASFIRTAMWISIKDELGLWNSNIGIRSGFKVVTMEDSEGDIGNIMRRMLGLG